ncbi:MAG: hypothetical protein LAT67_04240 [Balneolales bacterium]|nr:hypothetical protein [Balneolales bacterium]
MLEYISHSGAWRNVESLIHSQEQVAVDLEFDKNHYRYGFNLCLMQLQAGRTSYLVDPLAPDMDISHTFTLLENPKIQKICFAFGEDIRLLHSLSCSPKNLIDLSLVASLLNYPQISLTDLLMQEIGIETGKSAQQSNWYDRPLSNTQKKYAAEDVKYLEELANSLSSKARERGIMEWVEQENSVWETQDFTIDNHNSFLKEKEKKGLSEQGWHVYTKLMEFRELLAAEKNRPSYKIVDKSFLHAVARRNQHLENWVQINGIHPALKKQEVLDKARVVLELAVKEARDKGYSDNKPADKPPTKEKMASIRRYKKITRLVKRDCFDPVKNFLAKEHGENTAGFLINNRLIDLYLHENEDQLLPYRRDLIEYTANMLGTDVYGAIESAKSQV